MDLQYYPLPRVSIRNGCAYIARPGWGPENDYEVDLERCKTKQELVQWVYHLSEKNWVDAKLIRELIEVVSRHYGWPVYA